jgi:hypothetical protein
MLVEFESRERLDVIGPAYFVPNHLLPALNATGSVTLEATILNTEQRHEPNPRAPRPL